MTEEKLQKHIVEKESRGLYSQKHRDEEDATIGERRWKKEEYGKSKEKKEEMTTSKN